MSIKLFSSGLGVFAHPFDVSSPVRVGALDRPAPVIQDAPRTLGTLNTAPTIREALEVRPAVQVGTLVTTVQLPAPDVRRNTDIVPPTRPVVDLGVKPQLFSAESGPAPFETFFHDFGLEAFPFYNFWTPDELTNDRDLRGDRRLEDVPRFVKLAWNVAPDLPDPEERLAPRSVDRRPVRPVLFSREIERPRTFNEKGVGFAPEHLQAAGFSKVKGVLADGHIAPGVVEAVVSMPLQNTGVESHRVHATMDQVDHFDEDAFLTDPAFAGVSAHELRAQVAQVTNGVASMAYIAPDGVGSDIDALKQALFDGKFMVQKASSPGGTMRVSSVHPSSPTISFTSRAATPARTSLVDNVMELAARVSQPESVSGMVSSAEVKVKFFNPALGGVLDQKKVNLMSAPEHIENLSALAPQLPNLEVLSRTNLFDLRRRTELPSLPSPKMKPVEYIGYVIEKFRRQTSGVFTKVEEIDIPSREADTYIDTKVLYGETYRYRVKAIVRWTRPAGQGPDGPDPTFAARFGTHTQQLASYRSSYFSTEWGATWAYASCIDDQPPLPPDELTVRPCSPKQQVIITFRLPDNPQRDILKMVLLRKIQDEHGNDVSDWMQVTESDAADRKVDFAPQNVIYIDHDLRYFQESKMRVVYAAQCFSRHGEDSVLSEQLAVRLNADYYVQGEYPVEFVSSPGVRREYGGAFSVSPHRITRTEIVVKPPPTRVGKVPGTAALVFSGRDTMGNVSLDTGKYVCRVQSLDTGETVDFPFQVNFQNVQPRQVVSKFDFYVSAHSLAGKNSDQFDSEADQRLKKELRRYQDAAVLDPADEEKEVRVYDRAFPNDRW